MSKGALTPSTVFVPGGMPVVTYVPRAERELEARLKSVTDNLCKLVTLTGSTKSGKTVLANRIFPRSSGEAIWLDGGTIDNEEVFWREVHAQIDEDEEVNSETTDATQRDIATELAGEGGIRPLVFEGHPVVFIAIPHRRYDVVRVEKEMTGRVLSISVPNWTDQELNQIGSAGFPKLDINVDPKISKKLASEAYGSPHLMQEFCREVAIDRRDANDLVSDDPVRFKGKVLFKKSAEATGKIIFDKLAKGPRQRTDRMQRPLVGGGTADIYRVILLALSHISPGLNVIDYEVLRNAIRTVLTDNVPQANEVTRVLEKMAEIAAKDESSVSVIDWDPDDQKLHITDPFFAFFLKWSEDYIRSQPLAATASTAAND